MGSIVSSNKTKEEALPLLPQDIIKGEILTRVQVKTLARLRCVCKSWESLLSCDPAFAKSHLTRTCMDPNNSTLIVKLHPNTHRKKIHLLNSEYLKVAASVNGLVCVYHYIPGGRNRTIPCIELWNPHYIPAGTIPCIGIWNPATNQYKDIPPPARASIISGNFYFTLGFGFDPNTDDYKVIYVTFPSHRGIPLVADVYSCNAESWGKNSVKSTFLSRGVYCMFPTIVHGRPYWYNSNVKCPEHYHVMYFDLHHEVFKLLPGIEFVSTHKQRRVMVNLRDSLAMMIDYSPTDDTNSRSVGVYIYDERCGEWSKNYTVRSIIIPGNVRFLHSFSNGDLLYRGVGCLILVTISHEAHGINRLGSYISVYENTPSRSFFSIGYGYIESLVSVKGMKPMHVSRVESDILVIDRSF